MKKKIVLLSLLALPLMLYIYFSLVKHNSLFLPVINRNLSELPQGTTLDSAAVSLKGKITIIGFLGNNITAREESIFNINQKVNAKYKDFTDFQIIMLVPDGTQEQVKTVASKLKTMADISNWKFIFCKPEDIKTFYASLKANEPLDAATGNSRIFIIDKDGNLRGRKGAAKSGKADEFKDSYDAFSASELSNELTDDVKIVLREYRLALRKNLPKGAKREI
jgi:hypothetical protein